MESKKWGFENDFIPNVSKIYNDYDTVKFKYQYLPLTFNYHQLNIHYQLLFFLRIRDILFLTFDFPLTLPQLNQLFAIALLFHFHLQYEVHLNFSLLLKCLLINLLYVLENLAALLQIPYAVFPT